jgi:hypothetical protein
MDMAGNPPSACDGVLLKIPNIGLKTENGKLTVFGVEETAVIFSQVE